MPLAELSIVQLLLVLLGVIGIGFSKSGFSGVGMVHVLIFAFVFGAVKSTGILLPLLIVGDVLAVKLFGAEVQWGHFRRLLIPALIGVVIGWSMLSALNEAIFKPLVGSIVLGLTILQSVRIWRPELFEKVPHSYWFSVALGLLAGITTMLANAAGPIVALYLLAVSVPKYQLIGTSAWLFLTLNVFKVPFSTSLGLINWSTLLMNLLLSPCVWLGMMAGRAVVKRVSQKTFDSILLVITALAALRLIVSAWENT